MCLKNNKIFYFINDTAITNFIIDMLLTHRYTEGCSCTEEKCFNLDFCYGTKSVLLQICVLKSAKKVV